MKITKILILMILSSMSFPALWSGEWLIERGKIQAIRFLFDVKPEFQIKMRNDYGRGKCQGDWIGFPHDSQYVFADELDKRHVNLSMIAYANNLNVSVFSYNFMAGKISQDPNATRDICDKGESLIAYWPDDFKPDPNADPNDPNA